MRFLIKSAFLEISKNHKNLFYSELHCLQLLFYEVFWQTTRSLWNFAFFQDFTDFRPIFGPIGQTICLITLEQLGRLMCNNYQTICLVKTNRLVCVALLYVNIWPRYRRKTKFSIYTCQKLMQKNASTWSYARFKKIHIFHNTKNLIKAFLFAIKLSTTFSLTIFPRNCSFTVKI